MMHPFTHYAYKLFLLGTQYEPGQTYLCGEGRSEIIIMLVVGYRLIAYSELVRIGIRTAMTIMLWS